MTGQAVQTVGCVSIDGLGLLGWLASTTTSAALPLRIGFRLSQSKSHLNEVSVRSCESQTIFY